MSRLSGLSDIPQEQGCYCIAWNPSASTTKEIWVEIHKPQLKSYPKVPLELQPWLVLKHVEDSQRDFPELLESISVEETVEDENGSPAKQVVTLYLVVALGLRRSNFASCTENICKYFHIVPASTEVR